MLVNSATIYLAAMPLQERPFPGCFHLLLDLDLPMAEHMGQVQDTGSLLHCSLVLLRPPLSTAQGSLQCLWLGELGRCI